MGSTSYGYKGNVNVAAGATPPPIQTWVDITGRGMLKSAAFTTTYDYNTFVKITIDGKVVSDDYVGQTKALGTPSAANSGSVLNMPFDKSLKIEYHVDGAWSSVRNTEYWILVEVEV